jgi:hypothetical protein
MPRRICFAHIRFAFLKIKSDVQNRSDTAHRLTDNCCLNSQIASHAIRMPAAADAPGQFAFAHDNITEK